MLAILSAVVVFFLAVHLVLYNHTDQRFAKLAKLTFVLHAVIAIAILPFVYEVIGLTWDIGSYHRAAMEIYNGEIAYDSTAIQSFGVIMAILYTIFTPDLAIPSLLNGVFAVLTPIPAAVVVRQLYPELQETIGVKTVILLLPTTVFFMTLPMRDTMTVFVFFVSLALITKGINQRSYWRIIAAVPFVLWVSVPRMELAMITLLGVLSAAGAYIVDRISGDLSTTGIIAVLGAVGAAGFGLFTREFYSVERANSMMQTRARDGAAYLEWMEIHSWYDFLLVIPGRAIYFQFMPFPLYARNLIDILTMLSLPVLIAFAFGGIYCLIKKENNQLVAVTLVVIYAAGIAGYGLINSNFGTTVRHRIPFVYLLVIFAAPLVEQWVSSLIRRLNISKYKQADNRG